MITLTYDRAYRGYVADVVNLFGCMSQGKTKKEAIKNAKKAIKAYMEAMDKKEKESQRSEVITLPMNLHSFSYA